MTTNKVDLAATLASLGTQADDDSVDAEKKLDNKEPAHFHIEKTLNKAVGSPIPYDDSYGPITYTLKDADGNPAAIYKLENGEYKPLAAGEARWLRWLARAAAEGGERWCLLEFMPDDRLETLAAESAALREIAK